MDKKTKIFWLIRIITAFAVLVIGIFFTMSKKYFDTHYDFIKSFGEIRPIEFQQGDTIEQTMIFTLDKVRNIGICVVARTNDCTGKINIDMLNEDNNLVWQASVNAEFMQIQEMTWFDVQQYVESQKNYILRISSVEMTGTIYIGSIEMEDSSNTTKESAFKNEVELSAPIVVESAFDSRLDKRMRMIILIWAFVAVVYTLGFEKLFLSKKRAVITLALTADILLISIYFRVGFEFNESLNYIMFAGLVAAFFVIAVFYLFMLFKKIDNVELYFAVSTFILGIVYSTVFPAYSMPDEEFHFAQAYRLSNAIMGQPINDAQGYIYMRECDINPRESRPNNSYTIDMIKAIIRGDHDRSETMASSECQRIASGPVTMYVPQAIGITIGKLFHVNYARLVFMARFMNLITFIFVTYWAIKIIPYGKWIFFAICQIPMLLETVSSCSYDTPILAFAFLFIAYLLKLCVQTEKVSIRQMGVLGVIAFFFAPLKPVYMPLTALVFLLPDKSISDEKWKSRACKFIIVAAALISVMFTYKYSIGSMSQMKNDIVYENIEITQSDDAKLELETIYSINNNKPYQWPSIEYMLRNPFNLLESLMGSFIVYADEYWMALIGCGLTCLWDLRNPAYVGILTLFLLYIAFKKDNGQNDVIVDLKGKLWTILLIAGSLFGVFLAMYLSYSSPSDWVIGGVQGRYMLPLLIVLPFFLRKGINHNIRTKTDVLMLSLMVQILAILNATMQIWNR